MVFVSHFFSNGCAIASWYVWTAGPEGVLITVSDFIISGFQFDMDDNGTKVVLLSAGVCGEANFGIVTVDCDTVCPVVMTCDNC